MQIVYNRNKVLVLGNYHVHSTFLYGKVAAKEVVDGQLIYMAVPIIDY
jgi:hypothetical protein